jgi:hypothetical protein
VREAVVERLDMDFDVQQSQCSLETSSDERSIAEYFVLCTIVNKCLLSLLEIKRRTWRRRDRVDLSARL